MGSPKENLTGRPRVSHWEIGLGMWKDYVYEIERVSVWEKPLVYLLLVNLLD
jgi:hypothetical protein